MGHGVAYLDPVYTVPDTQGRDIKLNNFVALEIMILQNLTTTNQRNNGKSKYDLKLTKHTMS